jgi:hypothetical protein
VYHKFLLHFCEGEVPTILTCLLTFLPNPKSRVLEKLIGLQLVKKFFAFYETRRFINTFTSDRHTSLSSASSIKSIPHIPPPEDPSKYYPPIYAWVSPFFSFPQVTPLKPCTRLSPPNMRYMPHTSYSSRFYHAHDSG